MLPQFFVCNLRWQYVAQGVVFSKKLSMSLAEGMPVADKPLKQILQIVGTLHLPCDLLLHMSFVGQSCIDL
jgi:hypothetical protein